MPHEQSVSEPIEVQKVEKEIIQLVLFLSLWSKLYLVTLGSLLNFAEVPEIRESSLFSSGSYYNSVKYTVLFSCYYSQKWRLMVLTEGLLRPSKH